MVSWDPSVVSREVARQGGRTGHLAVAANTTAEVARERPRLLAVERCARLRAVVGELLRVGGSPASIAARLPSDYPGDQTCLDREVPADLQVDNASTRNRNDTARGMPRQPR